MAYTVPRTWVDSPTRDVATAALLNQYVRDDLLDLRNGNGAYCKLYLNANPAAILNNTNTVVSWDTAAFNVGGIWSAANPDRLVAPFTGEYLVLPNVEWRQNTSNLRNCSILRSAGGAAQYDLQSQGASGGKSNISAPLILRLTAGQYVRLQVFQSSGGSLEVHGGTEDRTRIAMCYLGDSFGSWASPAAWGLGITPTAAQLNQEWGENVKALHGLNSAYIRVHRTATQSLANNSHVPLNWQAAAYQQGITWSSATNPSRLTVPFTGTYLIAANVKFANVVGGRRGVGWHTVAASNVNYDMQLHPGNGVDTVTGWDFADLKAGDAVEIVAFQNVGAALNTAGTTEGDVWAHLSLWAQDYKPTPRWRTPRTWRDGFPDGVLTGARLNEISDQLRSLRSWRSAGAMVWLSADQSVSQNDRGALNWDRVRRNLGQVFDGSNKFVAPVDGVYLAMLNAEWGGSSSAAVQGIGYFLNDSSTKHDTQFQEGSNNSENQSAGDLIFMRKGESLSFYAFQDSPESVSLKGGAPDRSRAAFALLAAAA